MDSIFYVLFFVCKKSRVSGASLASAFSSQMLYRRAVLCDLEAYSPLYELAPSITSSKNPCPFAMLIPPVTLSFRPMSRHDHSSRSAELCANPLNNHNFVIFHCNAYAKTSLERSFFYLNVDALFERIGPEATELWFFEGEHFILFGHADAFDRRRSPFFLVVAIGTRSLSNPVAAIDTKGRKSILLVKDWVF